MLIKKKVLETKQVDSRREWFFLKSAVSGQRKGKRICENANGDHPANITDIHRHCCCFSGGTVRSSSSVITLLRFTLHLQL